MSTVNIDDFRQVENERYEVQRAYSVYLPTCKGKQEVSITVVEEDSQYQVYVDAVGSNLSHDKLIHYLMRNHYCNWQVYRDSVEECLSDVQTLLDDFVLIDQEDTNQFLKD